MKAINININGALTPVIFASKPKKVDQVYSPKEGSVIVVLEQHDGGYAVLAMVANIEDTALINPAVMDYWTEKQAKGLITSDLLNYLVEVADPKGGKSGLPEPNAKNPYQIGRQNLKSDLESWIKSDDNVYEMRISYAYNDKKAADMLSKTLVNNDIPTLTNSYNQRIPVMQNQAEQLIALVNVADCASEDLKAIGGSDTGISLNNFASFEIFYDTTLDKIIDDAEKFVEIQDQTCSDWIAQNYSTEAYDKCRDERVTELNETKDSKSQAESDRDEQQTELNSTEEKLTEAKNSLEERTKALESSEATLAALKLEKANCVASCSPVDQTCLDKCSADYDEDIATEEKTVAEITVEISELQDSISQTEDQILRISDEINELNIQINFYEGIETSLSELLENSSQANDNLNNYCTSEAAKS